MLYLNLMSLLDMHEARRLAPGHGVLPPVQHCEERGGELLRERYELATGLHCLGTASDSLEQVVLKAGGIHKHNI